MESKRVKLRGIQRKVAERLAMSHREIPQVTTIREVSMEVVLSLRKQLSEQSETKFSLEPFLILAVLKGMQVNPVFNAQLEKDEIVYFEDANIGVAITVGSDLVVPILKSAQKMTFRELNDAYNDLVARTRTKRLAPEDFSGGTFTITNSGALGGEIFTPIINYPQSAILGVGRIKDKPVVGLERSIVTSPMMYLCLSYDHRIINGSHAVGMLGAIDEFLQKPSLS